MGSSLPSLLITFSLISLFAPVLSAPVPLSRIAHGTGSRDRATVYYNESPELPFMKDYSEFQISDGYGGTAEEEAAAVFLKPFEGVDLATVPYEVFDKLKLTKEEAEDIEIEAFEPGIEEAGEETSTGRALKVGLVKNRVLYATASLQALVIEAAHNRATGVVDPYEVDDLDYARRYLAWTIQADRKNDGEPSLGVT